jgi:hypothetical protein
MKKVTKVLAMVVTAMVLFSACHSAKSCPAYGKVEKPAVEKRS